MSKEKGYAFLLCYLTALIVYGEIQFLLVGSVCEFIANVLFGDWQAAY